MIGRPSFLLTILLQAVLVAPEMIDLGFNMILDASSAEIYYVKGFLQAPASIDLSNIRWITNTDLMTDLGDDQYTYIEYDDEFEGEDDDEDDSWEYDDETETTDVPEEGIETAPPSESILEENSLETAPPSTAPEQDDTVTDINTLTDTNTDTNTYTHTDTDTDTDTETVEPPEPVEPEVTPEETNETNNDNVEVGDNPDEQEPVPVVPSVEETIEEKPQDGGNENEGGDEVVEEAEADDEAGEEAEVEQDQEQQEGEEDNKADDGGETEEENGGTANEEDLLGEEPDATPPPGDNNQKGGYQGGAGGNKNNGNRGGNKNNGNGGGNQNNGNGGGNQNNGNRGGNQNNGNAGGNQNNGNAADAEAGEESVTASVTEESTSSPTVDRRRRRRALQTKKERRRAATADQIVDVAVFPMPKDCETDSTGSCDWVALGVGAYDDEMEGGLSYCCSQDTVDRGICAAGDIGKLMVNSEFVGEHRKLKVPSQPFMDFQMKDAVFEISKSGQHVTLIANCNDDGLSILTLGYMEWKSVGGYLPGDMFGLMFFYGATAAIYLVLGLWYYYGMQLFQEAAIPIQKYILGTVVLGFFVTLFRGGDLYVWNLVGRRVPALTYIALTFGILFQGSLRCLGVMVAMGWGVVGDKLDISLGKIIFWGLLYSSFSLLRDSLVAAASSSQLVSTKQETEYGLAHILTLLIFAINIIFYYWIISSVKSTTAYLENMNQASKLKRHLRLRCLVITSLIIVTALTVINALQLLAREDLIPMKPFLSADQVWILDAVGYGNYFYIIFGVTILWRPNSRAKEYEMQIQLPGEENDLELTATVPTADDWEDDVVVFDDK